MNRRLFLKYNGDPKRPQNLKTRYGRVCYICGKALQPDNKTKHNGLTYDHTTAKSKGGRKLKPACYECNQRKRDMDLMVLEKGTVIKLNGIPFKLAQDTKIYGEKGNLLLARENDFRTEGKNCSNCSNV